MIVFSMGMIRSGSAWCFRMTNDLVVAAGHQNAHDIKQRFQLQSVMRYENCLLSGTIWQKSLILIPYFLGNTFTVKGHGPLTKSRRFLINTGIARATYIFRDPRDVAVSAFEVGRKKRTQGLTGSFTDLDTIETAILRVRWELEYWDGWMQHDKVLSVRYEDLLADTIREMKRLAGFLSLDVSSQKLQDIVAAYRPKNLSNANQRRKGLHLNKGIVGRFRQVMTLEQLNLCQKHFDGYLQRMGYED